MERIGVFRSVTGAHGAYAISGGAFSLRGDAGVGGSSGGRIAKRKMQAE
jgi:hypothetical protein